MNERLFHSGVPLFILGGDPGGTTGLVFVKFDTRKRDGTPLWLRAELLGHAAIAKPEQKDATPAELDILHRRKLVDRIIRITSGENNASPDVVVLEEPLDGGGSWKGAQGQRGQARDTAFRLGVHYANLLAASANTNALRYYSFPVQTRKGRRGWYPPSTTRASVLQRCTYIMQAITTPAQFRELPQEKTKTWAGVSSHLLMALGVVNFFVEHYAEIVLAEGR
jgi:hypothetical protein